ncbi:MAG: hypothetical protein ABIT20_09680 [Gemmatimonadaceae bacterium]
MHVATEGAEDRLARGAGVKLGPGLDAASSAFDATQVDWAFFAQHPKR